jgi:hypothetical protein
MYFAGTQMHMVTFSIVIFELVILLIQIVMYLQWKEDRNQLYYLILLLLLLSYNIVGGLLPDPNFAIPIKLQNTLAFLTGFIMSWYFVFYFYAAFKLERLRIYVTKAAIAFLVFPFLGCFILPYFFFEGEHLKSAGNWL